MRPTVRGGYPFRYTKHPERVFHDPILHNRVIFTRLAEDETMIVNDVIPNQIYRITLAPHKEGDSSTVFFRILDNGTSTPSVSYRPNARIIDGDLLAKAEEISIVILILALWMVAIGLFVHRWGKIRMLEPYQPDYKAIHEPNCPLNPSSSPQLISQQSITSPRQRPPTFKALPRKSSSLCFTPSMLRTVHVPSNCRVSVPRLDFHAQNFKGSYTPQTKCALHRLRGRLSSDSSTGHFKPISDLCRKARSAENLRHTRITISPERSVERTENSSKRETDKKSISLENCHGSRQQPQSGTTQRGSSLDSAPVRKSSPSATPWWSNAMGTSSPYPEGRTTPEIRISPTPPESSHHGHYYSRSVEKVITHSHSCPHSRPPGLQRQEPLDETLLPPPYATLLEEENEGDEGVGAEALPSRCHSVHTSQDSQESQESLLSQDMQYSSHESQENQFNVAGHRIHRGYHPLRFKDERKLTHMGQVSHSTSQSQDSQMSHDLSDGTRDTTV